MQDSQLIGKVTVSKHGVNIEPDHTGRIVLSGTVTAGNNNFNNGGICVGDSNVNYGGYRPSPLQELTHLVRATGNPDVIEKFAHLVQELNKPEKDDKRLKKLWEAFKNAASVNGTIQLATTVGNAFGLA